MPLSGKSTKRLLWSSYGRFSDILSVTSIMAKNKGISALPFPRSPDDFRQEFPDESACREYLQSARWPREFVCPRDHQRAITFINERRVWVCENRHHISLTTDTAMHKSRIPIRLWFLAAFRLVTYPWGITAKELKEEAGFNRLDKAYRMIQRMRASIPDTDGDQLVGRVEVGTVTLGALKGLRGRTKEPKKSLVVCAAQVRSGKPVYVRLQKLSVGVPRLIQTFLLKNAARGARLVIEGSKACQPLSSLEFRHTVISAKAGQTGAEQLSGVQTVLDDLRDWVYKKHHGVSGKYLQGYLKEYALRYNSRRKPREAFHDFLGVFPLLSR